MKVKNKMSSLERLESELIAVHKVNRTVEWWCDKGERAYVIHHSEHSDDEHAYDVSTVKSWWDEEMPGDVLQDVTKEEVVKFIKQNLGAHFAFHKIINLDEWKNMLLVGK